MSPAKRTRFWLIGLAVSILLIYLLRGMLLPFVAGMAIAYFLDPVADRLERAGLSRVVATTIITGFFFAVVVLTVVVLAPVIEAQILAFIQRVPGYVAGFEERVRPLVAEVMQRLSPGDIERLRSSAGDWAGSAAGWLLGAVRGLLSGGLVVLNVLSLLFITPIVTFYMLRDWDVMMARIDNWLPRCHAATIRAQAAEINRTLAGFLRGQASVCLVLGAFYAVALTSVGLDLGLLIGLGAGLISFIPYLGAIVGFVVGVGMAIAQAPGWALPLLVAGVFLLGQTAESYVLTPRLVGDKVGLHPVWIMFALLAGAALFGFVGVLLAVPVAAVIGVLVRFSLSHYLQSPLYHGDGEA